jgi:hypothetical protein
MRRILCLYLPNWPIQRVRAERNVGQVCNLPCLLHTRDPRRGLVVVAASDDAYRAGIRPGVPLAEAMTRSRTRCQQKQFLPYPDPAADLAELGRWPSTASGSARWSAEGRGRIKFQVQSQSQSPNFGTGPGT